MQAYHASLLRFDTQGAPLYESDGLMVVRVTTEGASYTYKARAASAEMQTQRVDFGRGLRANYFTLELMNENGADFDLDVIELAATPLTRRI